MDSFFWESLETKILLNPKACFPDLEKVRDDLCQQWQSHVFLATSGSTQVNDGALRLVALSKKAILISSGAVNQHLQCSSKDVFLNNLPLFHIGGLALFARAFLLGARVIDLHGGHFSWDPQGFVNALAFHKVTISSLVPTQIFDLVQLGLRPPASLRWVVVGGARLSYGLFQKAKDLGWPLLPSYGMSEAASQIATFSIHGAPWEGDIPCLDVLSHVDVSLSSEGRIVLEGDSLLSAYVTLGEHGEVSVFDPKNTAGQLMTQDLGCWKDGRLVVLGRGDDVVKVLGENVSFAKLDAVLERILEGACFHLEVALFAQDDPRLGSVISLAFVGEQNEPKAQSLLKLFNDRVLPYERILKLVLVSQLPKTDLGKLQRKKVHCFSV